MNNRADNIPGVIQILRDYEQKHRKNLFYDSTFAKCLFLICICTLIVGLILAFIRVFVPSLIIDLIGIILMFVTFICAVIYMVFTSIIPVLKELYNPIDTHLERMQKSTKDEAELIKNLADVDFSTLEQTIKRFGCEVSQLESQSTNFSGIFQKWGIIPAAVALYIASQKKEISNWPSFFQHMDYVFYFFIGSFIGAVISHDVIHRLKLFSIIVEAAKDIAEFRKSFSKP